MRSLGNSSVQMGHSKVGGIIAEQDVGCGLMRHEDVSIGEFDCGFGYREVDGVGYLEVL